jgi:hypothetical protein
MREIAHVNAGVFYAVRRRRSWLYLSEMPL